MDEHRIGEHINKTLTNLKARQDAGERMPCPRCGADAMDDKPARNALSRQADISVCDACGVDEALRAFNGNVLPLSEWACARARE